MTPRRSPRPRRGTAYLIVLAVCALVTVTGISALLAARVGTRAQAENADRVAAELAACSTVEQAALTIANTPDWRTRYQNDTEAGRFTLGSATCSWKLVDPKDGILNNGDDDPVLVVATVNAGRARQILQVTLEADHVPLDCLRVGLQTGGNMTFTNANVTCSQTISSNAAISASNCTVKGEIESVQAATGGTYTDTSPTRIQARAMPTAATVFDYYIANGTNISFDALPKSGSNGVLQNVVLAPGVNPYGAVNAKGIYVINCGGQTILVKNSRINGTLVLLNAGAGSVMQQSILFEPAVANYPSLMVQGSIGLNYNTATLSESASANYNPVGAPYQGVADADTTDSYPSIIKGLVYISGNLTTTNHPCFDGGMIIGGTMSSDSDVEITYRTTCVDDPPPGFTAPAKMKISPGTWRRVVE
jgi:hypothetical protein